MMGSGKSTVARLLGQKLQLPVVDTDKRISERAGVSIPFIFEMEGEAGFREREAAEFEKLNHETNSVVATGGGAVLRAQNRQHMREHGVTIYLETNVTELWRRLKRDKTRPLLMSPNPEERLAELLRQRHPIYAATANLTVHSRDQGAGSMADRIVNLLNTSTRTT
jgi:shikimate kinase